MLQIALFSTFHHNDHVFMLNFSTKLCGGFVYVHLAGLPAGHTALSADADTAITDQNTKTSKRQKYKYKYNQGFKDTKALCCNYRSLRPLCTALSADVSRRSQELHTRRVAITKTIWNTSTNTNNDHQIVKFVNMLFYFLEQLNYEDWWKKPTRPEELVTSSM